MKLYAIVDIETTGGSAQLDRITEIAIVHHDGNQVTDRYSTLINPERSIPYHIIGLTGITNEMVANAPKFYEVAADIIKWTEGRIFVAHNVHFDYGFIKEEFKSLGYTFTRNILDTVRLARLAFPGHKSYSLSNLIIRHNLTIENRHRALGDAMATAELFSIIMSSGAYEGSVNNFITMGLKVNNLPEGIKLDDILNVPETHGVYYFRNSQGALIYVGKSKNLKSRIAQHFSDHTQKSFKIRQSTRSFEYHTTGNELTALLKESIEIRSLLPLYNKAQRTPAYPYIVIIDESNPIPILQIVNSKTVDNTAWKVKYFTHKKLALLWIQKVQLSFYEWIESYPLDSSQMQEILSFVLNTSLSLPNELIHIYKKLFFEFYSQISLWFEEDFCIVDSGRDVSEKCIFLIHEGRFYGYTYIDINESIHSKEDALNIIKKSAYHPDLDLIVHHYIKKYYNKISIVKFH